MQVYISLLRGINVSGQKLIKMDALRKMYESLGFSGINTYLQSGNVLFKCENSDPSVLEKQISTQIAATFGFEVMVIVLTAGKLNEILFGNPFQSEEKRTSLYITFLSSVPGSYDKGGIESKKQQGEEISFSDQAVYLYCPGGYGKTRLTNSFLESRLKVGATTRNWKTANELFQLASQNE